MLKLAAVISCFYGLDGLVPLGLIVGLLPNFEGEGGSVIPHYKATWLSFYRFLLSNSESCCILSRSLVCSLSFLNCFSLFSVIIRASSICSGFNCTCYGLICCKGIRLVEGCCIADCAWPLLILVGLTDPDGSPVWD
jgi:hypothetical protein